MVKVKTVLTYLAPSLIAIGILVLDIFVSDRMNNNYYSTNDGCGGGSPSPVITIMLALVGVAISAYGVINAFRQHHKWLGTMAAIFTLLVILAGLVAFFVLEFEICF
jgi:glucan phosphoethanolaminetransferase (alkaline phosphatase superfamily)